MKRAKYLLIAVLLALPVLAWVSVAHAQSFRSGNDVTVASGQTVNSTLFATGHTVDIAGTVNGDVFCAGQSVTVSGRINGDVICAGQDLTVTGTVTGDVRLAGQQVTLGATVAGNATIGAETYSQTSGGRVDGDLTVGANQTTLNGLVGRDVAVGGTTLTVASVVSRNVQFAGTDLRLASNARVGGSINYTSNNTLQKSSGAIVAGEVTKHAPSKQEKHVWPFSWLFALYIFVSFLVAALLLVLLLPRMFERTARTARAHMGKTFLVGFLASIIVPALLMVIFVTVIGIPFALVAGLIWLLLGILAGPVAAYLLGHYVLSGSRNAILIMLVGAAILFLLYLLPFIGFLAWLLAEWFGLGALLLQARRVGMPHYGMETLPETTADRL
jgi:cytoskeletal protein CcmA (bactofilin family)